MPKATRVPYARKAKLAQRWERIIQKAIKPIVAAEVDRAASAVRGGGEPTNKSAAKTFQKKVFAVLRPRGIMVAAEGWNLAGIELGAPSKKADGDAFIGDPNAAIGSADEFLQVARAQDIDTYLQRTARSATAATSGRLDSIFNRARAWRDPDTGNGKTPRDIADELEELGGGFSESYSRMLARTVTTWAANEGAAQRYEDAGAKRMIWYTTEDDVTCEFCRAMDNEVIEIGDEFAGPDAPVSGDEGGTLDLPFGVMHPPLHPNCRCTLLPDLSSVGDQTTPPTAEEEEETTPPVEEPVAPAEEPAPAEPEKPKEPKTAKEIMERMLVPVDRGAIDRAKAESSLHDMISQDLNNEKFRIKYGVWKHTSPGNSILVTPPGTPEELAAIEKKHEEAKAAADAARRRWVDEIERSKEERRKILVHPDNREGVTKKVEVKYDNAVGWNGNAIADITNKQRKTADEVLDQSINLWLSNKRKEDFGEVRVAKSATKRGSYILERIVIPTRVKEDLDPFQKRTLVHEYAHHIEAKEPDVLKRTLAFRDKRRQEDGGVNGAEEKLSILENDTAYKPDEVSFRDKWKDRGWGSAYPGKIYSFSAGEVLTMGAERLYEDPVRFAKQDPEAFKLIVSIFRGVPEE